mmetsp:Transcript_128426/g.256517  ORF Transcript_128426/g.256517 Transcript_128426/m.256517 type:complete len:749 (-) Transcript_128426:350-2596(-)
MQTPHVIGTDALPLLSVQEHLKFSRPELRQPAASSALLQRHGPLQQVQSSHHDHLSSTLAFGGACATWLLTHRRRCTVKSTTGRVACHAGPYPEGRYDPVSAASYFQARPAQVTARATEFALALGGFAAKLVADKQSGKFDANAYLRAQELTRVFIQLGPTFIKIGQALSIRADLLPLAYLQALTELQDSVPPVPTAEADLIIERELGKAVGEIFSEITPEPIASASLGQVYRARVRDGPEVAVKVQRPGMEELIALDLHILRSSSGPLLQVLSIIAAFTRQDLVGLIDAWGAGFVDELNYLDEAANADTFIEFMNQTPLKGAVCAPTVLPELSTKKVLTTEWVVGTRLEESNGPDVTTLCSVAMNTYLTMLLEMGIVHADPHPGNLLRMTDGRLCILDWGLVSRLDREKQLTMIEHVANLVSREYSNLPKELVQLGFVPEGSEQAIAKSEVVDVLATVYNEWTDGGGAAKVNVGKFLDELQGLGRKYGDIFRVPPYFFYIARAFLVLEGIGLSNDPNYSIVSQCMPYVSKRLLKDPSPRIAGSLQRFVYGKQKDAADRMVNVDQIESITSGFSSYMGATDGLTEARSTVAGAGKLVQELADLLLGEGAEGNLPTPLQSIVIDELTKVLGASVRSAVAAIGLFPQPSSADTQDVRWSVVVPDETDKKTLETAQRLSALAEPQVRATIERLRALSTEDQVQVARDVVSKLWEYRAGAAVTGSRVAAKLLSQGLQRLSRDLTGTALRSTQ